MHARLRKHKSQQKSMDRVTPTWISPQQEGKGSRMLAIGVFWLLDIVFDSSSFKHYWAWFRTFLGGLQYMQVFLSHLFLFAPKNEIKSLVILIVDLWDLLNAVFSKAIILFISEVSIKINLLPGRCMSKEMDLITCTTVDDTRSHRTRDVLKLWFLWYAWVGPFTAISFA